ncbi:MFS transporter [Cordyceps fumosorosea ARSEF 2679]|uniref:MFS transporter n=1 Tax=Cordyceps fumosorosea (strain ARSEF 2679) TaxID=1081104 RepID=A0A167SV68_CORFA|nr:MFS transporter [Cordyceps fumosorosea ARSEF 2679]OAA59956.1 MFS transporter [Cordyceps fumosorosea ARSEF 2679]
MANIVKDKRDDLESMTSAKYIEELADGGTNLTEDAAEQELESKLRWKLDWHIVPLTSVIFWNARIAGLEKNLNMHGYQFNIALSVFYVSYILFEIPSNMVCKWMGPGRFIPVATFCFGVLTMCTGLVRDFSSLCGVRFLLGIFEAGIMPGLVYYLSRWYRQSEMTFRISLFIVSGSLAGAFGGLLASAILKIPSIGTLHSWRMIFVIEGIATCLLGIGSWFVMANDPRTARWLSESERALALRRLRSERPAEGAELVDAFNWTKIRRGILNPVVLATGWIFLLNSVIVQGASFFLPTLVAAIFPDRSVTTKQLLTVPPYVLGALCCIGTSYASWRLNRRGVFLILCAVVPAVGYALFIATPRADVRYGAIFLPFFGIYTYGALTNSHAAANVASDTARSSAIATNVMLGNMGGLAASWAYVPSDAPLYNIGTGLNLASMTSVIITATALYFWVRRDNRRRDELDPVTELSGLDASEIQNLDWKHPEFRWRN